MCQRHGSNQNSHPPAQVRKPLCNQFIHYHISRRGVFGINRFKLRNFAIVAIKCSFATVYKGSIMARIHRWSVLIYGSVSSFQPCSFLNTAQHLLGSGGHFKNTWSLKIPEVIKCQCCIKSVSFNVWVRYFVWKFECDFCNSQKIYYPYIEKCGFYSQGNDLRDLRAHKCLFFLLQRQL